MSNRGQWWEAFPSDTQELGLTANSEGEWRGEPGAEAIELMDDKAIEAGLDLQDGIVVVA